MQHIATLRVYAGPNAMSKWIASSRNELTGEDKLVGYLQQQRAIDAVAIAINKAYGESISYGLTTVKCGHSKHSRWWNVFAKTGNGPYAAVYEQHPREWSDVWALAKRCADR